MADKKEKALLRSKIIRDILDSKIKFSDLLISEAAESIAYILKK